MAWSIVLHEDFTAVNVKHAEHGAPPALLHTDRFSFFCF